jgi:hypothetical protein
MKFEKTFLLTLSISVVFTSAARAQLWQNLEQMADQQAAKGDWKEAEENYRQAWLLGEHMHASPQKLRTIRDSLEQAYRKNGQEEKANNLHDLKDKEVREALIGVSKMKMGDDFDTPKVMAASAAILSNKSIKVKTETICCGRVTRKGDAVLKPGDADYDLVASKLKDVPTGRMKLEPFELKSLSAAAGNDMKCGGKM